MSTKYTNDLGQMTRNLITFLATCIATGTYVPRWIKTGGQNDDGTDKAVEQVRCTRNYALALLAGRTGYNVGTVEYQAYSQVVEFPVIDVTDAHRIAATKVVEAWKTHTVAAGNDYEAQCKAIAERGQVSEKETGIAAAMTKGPQVVVVSNSQHFGVVGVRTNLPPRPS